MNLVSVSFSLGVWPSPILPLSPSWWPPCQTLLPKTSNPHLSVFIPRLSLVCVLLFLSAFECSSHFSRWFLSPAFLFLFFFVYLSFFPSFCMISCSSCSIIRPSEVALTPTIRLHKQRWKKDSQMDKTLQGVVTHWWSASSYFYESNLKLIVRTRLLLPRAVITLFFFSICLTSTLPVHCCLNFNTLS